MAAKLGKRVYQLNKRPETSGERGLPKEYVRESYITSNGLEGDFNRYRHEKRKDDPDMALLLMPLETLSELNREGWPIMPGHLGENITTYGIPYDEFEPGKKYNVGEAEIQISVVCEPCTNLYLLPYVGKEKGHKFLKTLKNRRGWYARVLKEGKVKLADSIEELI